MRIVAIIHMFAGSCALQDSQIALRNTFQSGEIVDSLDRAHNIRCTIMHFEKPLSKPKREERRQEGKLYSASLH
jgi:hypothetical protein